MPVKVWNAQLRRSKTLKKPVSPVMEPGENDALCEKKKKKESEAAGSWFTTLERWKTNSQEISSDSYGFF